MHCPRNRLRASHGRQVVIERNLHSEHDQPFSNASPLAPNKVNALPAQLYTLHTSKSNVTDTPRHFAAHHTLPRPTNLQTCTPQSHKPTSYSSQATNCTSPLQHITASALHCRSQHSATQRVKLGIRGFLGRDANVDAACVCGVNLVSDGPGLPCFSQYQLRLLLEVQLNLQQAVAKTQTTSGIAHNHSG